MHILNNAGHFAVAIDAKFWLLTSSLTSRAVTVPGMAKSSSAQLVFMEIWKSKLA
jgi:hypothetical protein